MNCPYCGEKTDNSEFCHKCGNRLITHTITTDYELSDTKSRNYLLADMDGYFHF